MHKIMQKLRSWWHQWSPKRLTYSQVILKDKPVAYYRLNETEGTMARDSSGNQHDAVIKAEGEYGNN